MARSLLVNSKGEIIRFLSEDGTGVISHSSEPIDTHLKTKKLIKELKGINNVGEWKLINVKVSDENYETVLGVKTIHSGEVAYQVVFVDNKELSNVFNIILEKIINLFGLGIILLSSNGIVLFSNQRVKEILGIPPFINIVSTNLLMSKTLSESGLSEEIVKIVKTCASKKIDLVFNNFIGRKKDLSISISSISLKKSNYILLLIEDMTEKKRNIFEGDKFLTGISELYKYIQTSLQTDDPSLVIRDGIKIILDITGMENGLLLRRYGNKLVKIHQFKKSAELEEILSNALFTENLTKMISNNDNLLITDLELLLPCHFFSIKNGLVAKQHKIENYNYLFIFTSLESKDIDTKTLLLTESLIDTIFFLYGRCLKNLSERFEIKLNNITKSVLSLLNENMDMDKYKILNIFNEKLFENFNLVFSALYLRTDDMLSPKSILIREDLSECFKFIDIDISNIESDAKFVNTNIQSPPYKIIECGDDIRKKYENMVVTMINVSDKAPTDGFIIMGFDGSPTQNWIEFIEKKHSDISLILLTICSFYDIKENKNESIISNKLLRDLGYSYTISDFLRRINYTLYTDVLVYRSKNNIYTILTKIEVSSVDLQNEINRIISQGSYKKINEMAGLIGGEDLARMNSKNEPLNIEMGLLLKSKIGGTLVLLWQKRLKKMFNERMISNIGEFIPRALEILEREEHIDLKDEILFMISELRTVRIDNELLKISLPIIANLIEKYFYANNLCIVLTSYINPVIEYGNGIFNIFENPDLKDKIIDTIKSIKFEGREITTIIQPEDNCFSNNEYLYIVKTPGIKKHNYIIISTPSKFDAIDLFTLEGIAFEFGRILS